MPFADSLSSRIRRATRLALNRLGREMVADVRQDISVWVEYIGGVMHRHETAHTEDYFNQPALFHGSKRVRRPRSHKRKGYERHTGGEVIRSEPGEPPRREFSNLWKSIKYQVAAGAVNEEDLSVFTNYLVAWWLEYGTRRIEPRPFWEPFRRRWDSHMRSLFKQYFAEALAGIQDSSGGDLTDEQRADYPADDSAFNIE